MLQAPTSESKGTADATRTRVRPTSETVEATTVVRRRPTPGFSAIGNQAMLLHLSRTKPQVQCKLEIGAVNDPLEAEADRIADQVMRMPAPTSAADSGSISPPHNELHRKCAACQEDEKTLRTQSNGEAAGSGEVPTIVHQALSMPGQSLDPASRAFFEPRFGRDFGQVRVNTSSVGAESARALRAQAYTLGTNIVLGEGYAPHSPSGRRLLAHELAHVAQQGGAPSSGNLRNANARGSADHEGFRLMDPVTRVPGLFRRFSSGARVAGTTFVRRQGNDEAAAPEGQKTHGQEVIDALTRPDPIAGVGDTGAAFAILRGLNSDELLAALIEVDNRGMVDILVSALQPDDRGEVATFIYAVRFTSSVGQPSDEFGVKAAQGMARLSEQEQNQIIAAVLKRRGSDATVQQVREGLSAVLESEEARQAQPESDDTGPPLLAGIAMLPWNPGGMPIPFYIGNSAHVAIAAAYAGLHRTDAAFYNFTPIESILQAAAALGRSVNPLLITAAQLGLKPDIANIFRLHLYEIKPVRLQGLGRTEALIYSAAFTAAGLPMLLGPTSEPGTAGTIPAPGGWFVYSAPEPGVITYAYRQPPRRKKTVTETAPATVPAPNRSLVERISIATGLTGTALTIYIIISEGTRLFPPRNLIPVP
jgi:hypothetical protein